MATKPIERLLFAQGGDCFFCERPLPREMASVEHLVAKANGGKDNDENCVAACQSLNKLFGRMSLKEKLKIVLHQRGNFRCPDTSRAQLLDGRVESAPASVTSKAVMAVETTIRSREDRFELIVKDLKRRGNSRPGKLDTLENTIRAYLVQLGEAPAELPGIMRELQSRAYVSIKNKKVTYSLP